MTTIEKIVEAIKLINANAEYKFTGSDLDSIVWLNGTTPISKTDIEAQYLNAKVDFLRKERNKKLAETDFYALSDVTMSAEMTTYRQALRDLPSNYTTSDSSELTEDLSNLNWPTKP